MCKSPPVKLTSTGERSNAPYNQIPSVSLWEGKKKIIRYDSDCKIRKSPPVMLTSTGEEQRPVQSETVSQSMGGQKKNYKI